MKEKMDSMPHHLSVQSILPFQENYLAQLAAAYSSLEGLGRFQVNFQESHTPHESYSNSL
jgi:hypothetical protein